MLLKKKKMLILIMFLITVMSLSFNIDNVSASDITKQATVIQTTQSYPSQTIYYNDGDFSGTINLSGFEDRGYYTTIYNPSNNSYTTYYTPQFKATYIGDVYQKRFVSTTKSYNDIYPPTVLPYTTSDGYSGNLTLSTVSTEPYYIYHYQPDGTIYAELRTRYVGNYSGFIFKQ